MHAQPVYEIGALRRKLDRSRFKLSAGDKTYENYTTAAGATGVRGTSKLKQTQAYPMGYGDAVAKSFKVQIANMNQCSLMLRGHTA